MCIRDRLGAVANIVLDPIFIFWLNLGVTGAAVATVLSQLLSAIWVLLFLTGRKTLLHLRLVRPDGKTVGEITKLGMAGFVMSATNGAVQIACNACLLYTSWRSATGPNSVPRWKKAGRSWSRICLLYTSNRVTGQ